VTFSEVFGANSSLRANRSGRRGGHCSLNGAVESITTLLAASVTIDAVGDPFTRPAEWNTARFL
jgi:hypothetical protein